MPRFRGNRTPTDREIGPLGTASRVLGGLAMLIVSIAVYGITAWDIAAALIALPLIAIGVRAVLIAAYHRRAVRASESADTFGLAVGLLVVILVVGFGIGLTFVTPLDGGVAIWCFFGMSMIVAAMHGDPGCEVFAVPNLLTGRRVHVGCLVYGPVDRAEAGMVASATDD